MERCSFMKIKQVEELVGVTSKNIRFYEDQGLITPGRAENGYREYGLEDVDVLKKIKMLRKLGVSIEEMKAILSGSEPLTECLEKTVDTMSAQQKNLSYRIALANQLMEARATIDTLDTDALLDEMDKMEKEGVIFMDVKKEDIHRKKKAGALVGGIGMLLFMTGLIVLMVWAKIADNMPWGVFFTAVGVFVAIMVAIGVALFSRLKEIDGGEEDEALKY